MKVRALVAVAVLAGSAAAGPAAQPVPEGIHSPGAERPSLCDTVAATVPALEAELSARLSPLPGNERFTAYADDANRRIWTFTTAAHPAHPAVACRAVRVQDGQVGLGTEIYCVSSRANCDALYREFEALNARALPLRRGD